MSKAKLLIALALTVCAGSSKGEPIKGKESSEDRDMLRQRINVARKEKLDELAVQDTACLSRFAVIDCQNLVGVRRREMLADLKRQEASLNEADRRQKGLDQLQSSHEKASDRTRRESELRGILQPDMLEKRQSAQKEKLLNHQLQAKSVAAPVPVDKTASGLDAASIERNRAVYSEKQRSVTRRRLDREKRLLEKTDGSAPLPQNP
jgi:hypothetical protein